MTNEKEQREKAAATRRGGRWGICTGRGGSESPFGLEMNSAQYCPVMSPGSAPLGADVMRPLFACLQV
jgi:hypothetical protein